MPEVLVALTAFVLTALVFARLAWGRGSKRSYISVAWAPAALLGVTYLLSFINGMAEFVPLSALAAMGLSLVLVLVGLWLVILSFVDERWCDLRDFLLLTTMAGLPTLLFLLALAGIEECR